ncbi:hypothetical protein GCM10028807_36320 [Spirosoma daeguense]
MLEDISIVEAPIVRLILGVFIFGQFIDYDITLDVYSMLDEDIEKFVKIATRLMLVRPPNW